MLLKLIRTLLRTISAMTGGDSTFVRILLQSDGGAIYYLFDAFLNIETGRLDIHFGAHDGVVAEVDIAYAPGEEIPEAAVTGVAGGNANRSLERQIIELSGSGRSCSLIACSDGLEQPFSAFSVGDIRFHPDVPPCFRSQPLHLFVHARPAGA